jgi:AraC-like DNA-binding protein
MALESWQLDAVPAADRDELWRHVINVTHLPWSLDTVRDPAPVTETWVRRRPLGDLSLIDCRAGRCAGRRRDRDLAATDGEYIGVLLVRQGAEVLVQSGHDVVVRAGDIVAWDSLRPARFAVLEPLRKQTLLVPRARFQQLLPRPELAIARRVPPSAATDLLRAYLGSLARADLDPATAFAAGNAALELVGAALGAVITPSRAATREAMRVRITQHIEARLGDRAALRPRRIAADNAISVRTLHSLFQSADDTVGAYVRRRRLHHARAELTRPPWPTVTAVAHRWGFSDAANFSRSFRAQYGQAPSEARDVARSATDPGA